MIFLRNLQDPFKASRTLCPTTESYIDVNGHNET